MVDFSSLDATQRLEEYFKRIGDVLGNASRRESFAMYALGLLGEGERKSIEPIAARACADPNLKGAGFRAGTIMYRLLCAATRSSSLNACSIFPPRPEGRHKTTRSSTRPERHFHDSFITARLAIARVITTWLPRCPTCHCSRSSAGTHPLRP